MRKSDFLPVAFFTAFQNKVGKNDPKMSQTENWHKKNCVSEKNFFFPTTAAFNRSSPPVDSFPTLIWTLSGIGLLMTNDTPRWQILFQRHPEHDPPPRQQTSRNACKLTALCLYWTFSFHAPETRHRIWLNLAWAESWSRWLHIFHPQESCAVHSEGKQEGLGGWPNLILHTNCNTWLALTLQSLHHYNTVNKSGRDCRFQLMKCEISFLFPWSLLFLLRTSSDTGASWTRRFPDCGSESSGFSTTNESVYNRGRNTTIIIVIQ